MISTSVKETLRRNKSACVKGQSKFGSLPGIQSKKSERLIDTESSIILPQKF